jgi:hypothetical protein
MYPKQEAALFEPKRISCIEGGQDLGRDHLADRA